MQNLQTAGKEMFTMERNEKDPNLSKIETFFLSFYGSQGIAQNVEERKVDVFFITISIVIPAVQFLTQNIIKELQRRVQNIVEHLR